MIRGGENLLYGFLAGAITAKLLKSFCNIEIPPSLLFAVAVALFTAVFCFCLKIPIASSKVQRRAFFGAVILFFFVCGHLNDTRSHFMSETGREGKTGRMVSAIREKAIERTKGMISSSQQGSVAVALTIGEQKEIPFQLKKAYSESGTLHALALSGMHLSVFSVFIQVLLKPFLGRRNARFISILIIAFYVFYIGPKASILRAFILSAVFFASGGRLSGVKALFLTFTLHSIFFPLTLLSLASCYSYLSLLGIMSLSPVLKTAFDEIILLPESIVSNISAGAAAILFTSPLSYCVFGTYQLSAIITGGVISSLVYLYMLLSIIPFLFPLRKYVYFLIESLMIIGARFPHSDTMTPYIVFSSSVLLLLLLSYILKKKRRLRCGTLIMTARKK